jgi:hypothetical protein
MCYLGKLRVLQSIALSEGFKIYKVPKGRPSSIQMRSKTLFLSNECTENQLYSLAHELGHYLYEYDLDKSSRHYLDYIYDSLAYSTVNIAEMKNISLIEKEAWLLGENLLSSVNVKHNKKKLSSFKNHCLSTYRYRGIK